MRIEWTHAIRVATLLAAAMPAVAAASEATSAAAIRRASAAFVAAYNSGNVEAVVDRFEPTAVVMPPNAPPVRGRDSVREFVTHGVAGARANGIVVVLESGSDVHAHGDLGWQNGAYAIRKDGATIDSGKYLEVRHRSKGQWRMLRRIWNSDRPLAGK